jgi:Flp pilus assembly protein TadG
MNMSKRPVLRKRARQGRDGERGNALIEFALCAVIMLLLTVGVTDFARLFAAADMAASAASAGAQYGALSPAHWSDYTGMQSAALNDAGNASGVTATGSNTCYCYTGTSVDCPADCSGGGSAMTYITVKVTVPFTPLFPYPWMPSVTSMSTSNSVRVQ